MSKTNNTIINVVGKRWFQKSYGNTYHKVCIYIPGQETIESDITYGYGDQYKQTACELLQQQGTIPDSIKYNDFITSQYINFYVEDVERKKYL